MHVFSANCQLNPESCQLPCSPQTQTVPNTSPLETLLWRGTIFVALTQVTPQVRAVLSMEFVSARG